MNVFLVIVLLILLAFLYKKGALNRKNFFIPCLATFLLMALVAGCSNDTSTKSKHTPEPVKAEQKEKKKEVKKPQLKSNETFATNDDGSIKITGKTEPNAKVKLTTANKKEKTTKADKNGNYEFLLSTLSDPETSASITVSRKGKKVVKTITLKQSNGYKKKLAEAKKERERKKEAAAKKEQLAKEKEKKEKEKKKEQAKKEADRLAKEKEKQIERDKKKKAVTAKKAQPAPRSNNYQAQKPVNNNENQQTVYITATGNRYHFSQSCRGLNRSKGETKITKAEAEKGGYTRCKWE